MRRKSDAYEEANPSFGPVHSIQKVYSLQTRRRLSVLGSPRLGAYIKKKD